MISNRTVQRGLSLIELIIALAISSFLILGVTQIYIDNKRSALFQQSQAVNQESARFAETIINDHLGKAGFRRAPDQALEFAFPAVAANADCKAFARGAAATGLATGTGICLRYQPLVSGEVDCTGSPSKAFNDTQPFSSSRELAVIAIRYVPEQSRLECKNLNPNTGTAGYVTLLEGVADFRFDYGVGPADLFTKELRSSGDRFVAAANWTASSGPIRAARYSVLLASRPNQRTGDSKIFNDWVATADTVNAARLNAQDDNQIYQVATSTQTLRNLMP